MEPLSKRLRTDLQQILSGRFFEERAERLENQLKDLSFNFHHDFTKKIVQFAEQTNGKITYLFLSLLRQNCDVVQSFSSSKFLERIFSSLHFFITTNTILGMLNSTVMAQPLGAKQLQKKLRKSVFMSVKHTFTDFHALKYDLAKPSTSLNLKFLQAIFIDTRHASHPCE